MSWMDWKVKELAAKIPGAAEVLQARGVDMCCGGEHTLEQMANAKGADAAAVDRAIDERVAALLAPGVSVAEILARWPGAREVLDRHGLHGCGGAQGPAESLEYFAGLHGIPVDRLVAELREGARGAAPAGMACPAAASPVFESFFRAGLAVLFTGGATFGAVMLLLYGLRGDFLSTSLFSWVQAHGFSMIYGFVLLFLMGFSFEALPRFRMRPPPPAALTRPILGLVLAGTILRFAAAALPPAAAAVPDALVLVATVLFARFVFRTLRPVHEPHEPYILIGTVFLVGATAAEAAFWIALSVWPGEESFLSIVATYLPAVRDAQFLGFASLWILGVGQRVWPNALGFRPARRGLSRASLALTTLGSVGAISAWLAYRLAATPPSVMWAFQAMFAVGAAALVVEMRLFRPRPAGGRAGKFVAASAAWLVVALTMLLLMPLYFMAHGGFSHAYFGAVRHAFTLGFVTLAIVGVSSKIVPVWTGRAAGSNLTAVFVLLNLGCALRVATQTMTDWVGAPAFYAMPLSAGIEVLGLGLWAWEIWPRRAEAIDDPLAARTVADVIAASPGALDILVRHGFKMLSNPILRGMFAPRITLGDACRRHGVDWKALKRDLEASSAGPAVSP